MAYSAMAKVVSVLCVAFLVAHVESAHLLKQYDDARVTAETFPSHEVPVAGTFAELHPDGPVAEYNYNLAADEGKHATEGIVVGETTTDPPLAQESQDPYVFGTQHEDEPVFTSEDTTTQNFEALPEPVYDSTYLVSNTRDFEFQETPDEEVSQGSPGFFAFDDSLASP